MSSGRISGHIAENWDRVRELFSAALECEPDARNAFLAAECAGDTGLRAEVESLLAAHEHGSVLDELAAQVAPLAAGLSAPTAANLVGRTVGHYRITSRMADGGMGVVYEAIDERLGRTVALKFLHPRFALDETAAIRFRSEARTVAALEHPNVCTVYETGETEGQLFLAMPRYTGETLQQRVARGPLPVGDAVAIALQIARGLGKAHDRGIVHRDIKPSNVFLTSDGVVKILDFGIAKLGDVSFTGAGGPLGTVHYMSPEQLYAAQVDARTDVWALGVVLYEMLTGVRPFEADGNVAIITHIEHTEPVMPSARQTGVPAALDALVMRALAKPRDLRFANGTEFEHALAVSGLSSAAADARLLPLPAPALPAPALPAPAPALPVSAVASSPTVRMGTGALLVVGATLMALFAVWFTRNRASPAGDAVAAAPPLATAAASAAGAGPSRSIVVLPFVNMTANDNNEFLSDGLTEEVITRLASVNDLKVISRTSTMHYKGSKSPLRDIANELHVAHVLEGSVRQDGDRLRITVQLIDAATDAHRWAASFDVEPREPFRVEEEIARQVVRELEVTLGETDSRQIARRGTLDVEAYELYRRGRFHWLRRTPEDHVRAIAYFQRAIARDSNYADPYAGLADAYLTQFHLGLTSLPEKVLQAKQRQAAEHALALDAQSTDAHVSYGISRWWRRDWLGAQSEFRRAIELNPGNTTARAWYALLLTGLGHNPEAQYESRSALEVDPFALINQTNLGWSCLMSRDLACASDAWRRSIEINPTWSQGRGWMGLVNSLLGRHDDAVREMETAIGLAPKDGYEADLAYVLARAGRSGDARRTLNTLAPERRVPLRMARAYIGLGEADSAFAWLDRTDFTWPHRATVADPTLDPLRKDPRFAQLVARVNREMGLR